jgi:hypothetical protein
MMATAIIQGRPKSRQSTTSITSNSTQPIQPQPEHAFAIAAQLPSAVWQQHEETIAQLSQQQFTNNSYGVSPQMQAAMGHHAHVDAFGTNASVNGGANTQMQQHILAASFEGITDRGTPIMDVQIADQSFQEQAGDASKRKKGTSNTQANDQELRRLFRENEGKELDDIAHLFSRDENTSKLEKLKQIFGMLWYEIYIFSVLILH